MHAKLSALSATFTSMSLLLRAKRESLSSCRGGASRRAALQLLEAPVVLFICTKPGPAVQLNHLTPLAAGRARPSPDMTQKCKRENPFSKRCSRHCANWFVSNGYELSVRLQECKRLPVSNPTSLALLFPYQMLKMMIGNALWGSYLISSSCRLGGMQYHEWMYLSSFLSPDARRLKSLFRFLLFSPTYKTTLFGLGLLIWSAYVCFAHRLHQQR